ncbi:MAG: hypothetical protein KIS92_02080 [Planctomycetota bacterium]|nr:hypothetical protein [Planctomycetota bacterium]
MHVLACEKCARPVPMAHLAEGRALQTSANKVICAVCCKHAHPPRRRISGAITLPKSQSSNRIQRVPSQTPPPRPKITAETAILPRAKPATERKAATARTATSLRIERHWVCHVCGVPVDPKEVAAGGAELRDGRLWCRACFKKQDAPAPKRRWIVPAAAAGLAAVGVSLAVPGAALIVLALGCAAAALFVLLSGEMPWAFRAGVTTVALFAAGACVALLAMLQDHSSAAKTTGDLSGFGARIEAALAQNKVRDALAELQKLKAAAARRPGEFATPAAEERLASARKAINAWLADKYPDSNEIGRQLVLAFAEAFPGEDDERFERIVVEGDSLRAALRVAGDAERVHPGQGPEEDRRYTQSSLDAWLVATYVFDRIGAIDRLHLDLKIAGGTARELDLTRAQYQALRRQPLPQAMLSRKDWARRLEPGAVAGAESR